MSSQIRKVALVGGSGHLGPFLLAALQANPSFDVTVITRSNSSATFTPSTKVIKVSDGYPDDEILTAFQDASIKAGVKHLIALTYGGSHSKATCDLFPIAANNAKIVEDLKARETAGWTCCVMTGLWGINPKTHTAKIWDSGTHKFSTTNLSTIGHATAKILSDPSKFANRNVHISSFEVSMNDILSAYKKASGVEEWGVSYTKTEDEIVIVREEVKEGNMYGMAKLALATCITEGTGSNFREEGLLDNEILGLVGDDLDKTVKGVLEGGLQMKY